MASFPLQRGRNSGSNENRNVQKYINFYRFVFKKTPYVRITEDGQFGSGTEGALRELVSHTKTSQWGGTTTTATVQVGRDWYVDMLAQLRKAGWTPYGDSASSQSSQPQNQQQTSYADGRTPEELFRTRKNTRKYTIGTLALLAIGWGATGKDSKRGNRIMQAAAGFAVGVAAYYGLDYLIFLQTDKEKYILALKADLRKNLAAGAKLSYSDSTYLTWANQIEKAAGAQFKDGTEVVSGIMYKLRSITDLFALEIAYGLRTPIVKGGFLGAPLDYIDTLMRGEKQALREVLSLLDADPKKDLNRHLAQFNAAPIA